MSLSYKKLHVRMSVLGVEAIIFLFCVLAEQNTHYINSTQVLRNIDLLSCCPPSGISMHDMCVDIWSFHQAFQCLTYFDISVIISSTLMTNDRVTNTVRRVRRGRRVWGDGGRGVWGGGGIHVGEALTGLREMCWLDTFWELIESADVGGSRWWLLTVPANRSLHV